MIIMSMFPIITQKCLKTSKNYDNHNSDINDRRENLFKIENFLNNDNSSDNNNDQDNLSNNNKNIGVFAAESLKNNSVSCGISSVTLITKSLIQKYEININNIDGFLKPILFKNDLTWFKCIKLSKDIYSHNAIIELNSNELIRIRIVKDIEDGEEIIAWFSEEISMLMSIPFLTPTNIRGNNCYKCHNCNKTFEYPNPLKIHIATLCGQQKTDILWIKLHYTLRKTAAQQNIPQHDQYQQPLLSTTQETIKSFNQISLFPNDIRIRSTSFDRQHQSAFKPITSPIKSPLHQHLIQNPTEIRNSSPPSSSSNQRSTTSHHHHQHHRQIASSSATQTAASVAEAAALNAAAQIETIVSNMGASKQGHLCIYCGKIYSRKYGLKIHIRTHTGFKPLKCKFCLRPFGDPSNLNKHVRLHLQTGNMTYRCHLCHKTLARRRDLQRHIETKHCLSEMEKRNLC